MDEILKTLAQHTGISVETARTALGATLTFLKEHLPEGLSGQMMKSLPDAHGLAAAYEADKPAAPGGGLMGTLTGLAGKLLGGNGAEATKLLGMLQGAGLDLKQIEAFLPKVLDLIKAHLPAELSEKIIALIPGMGQAAGKA